MHTATACLLVFHGELAPLARSPELSYPLERRASIKDIAESLGVPHTEIHSIQADDRPAGFDLIPSPGQSVHLHPATAPLDPLVPQPLRPEPLPALRFLADANVGRLATLLRVLGFDTASARRVSDAELADQAQREQRFVLSRDRGLLKRKAIVWGRLIRANHPREQLGEVLGFLGLMPPFAAFSRCVRCNVPLAGVAKADVLHRLEPKTRLYYHEFHQCPACGRVYWPGSHHAAMLDWVAELARG